MSTLTLEKLDKLIDLVEKSESQMFFIPTAKTRRKVFSKRYNRRLTKGLLRIRKFKRQLSYVFVEE